MRLEDPQSLRLFIAVCETGSIATAAAREAISPSALSKRISDLEESLGTALLHRGQRGVRPTAAGEALIIHARSILDGLQRMRYEVGEYGDGVRGHVRVLAVSTSIVEFLTEDLTSFLAAYPHVRVSLDERVTEDVVQGIESGMADIGICRKVAVAGIDVYPGGADRYAVVVSGHHPLASRTSVRFEETLAYEHVGLPQNAAMRVIEDRVASELAREVRMRFFVSSFDAALCVVSSGLALSILPVEAIERFRSIYNLRILALTEPWATQEFIVCAREAALLSPAARQLLNHLVACRAGSPSSGKGSATK
ncbi:LysR family transcriptional regulator [Cupriavidus oxalaticus]|uniref:LysR family transcriptional regulator n=1 Tax=Cupriavidus oxalaticus TaxID=96344 RepID=A0A4P7LIZ3_9BURK|nr:LysR family transcriptional regulator [Cupriavidus oxalaticus]QBY56194.1 LysR family transcriptional regulator [Cupriavidus oxalaticus]